MSCATAAPIRSSRARGLPTPSRRSRPRLTCGCARRTICSRRRRRIMPPVAAGRRALIVYTSGTTARPKGVVLTHANVAAHVGSLTSAWAWTADDRTLLVLPLHHVHGLINVLCCALGAGACCEMPPRFDAGATWARLASGEITRLHRRADDLSPADRGVGGGARRGCAASVDRRPARAADDVRIGRACRPRCSRAGRRSAATCCSSATGMTETGMVLSNPLDGERRPGLVGLPLPGVDVRLIDEQGGVAAAGDSRGSRSARPRRVPRVLAPARRSRARAFHDGWFRTGDVGVLDEGSYRLLGRLSVDIIKTGGYKISALEIEDVLRAHPAVADCAVVGAADPTLGRARVRGRRAPRRRRTLTRGAAGLGKCTPLVAQGPEGPHVRARPPAQRDGESRQAADLGLVQVRARASRRSGWLRWRSGGLRWMSGRLRREVRDFSVHPGLLSSPRTSQFPPRRTSHFFTTGSSPSRLHFRVECRQLADERLFELVRFGLQLLHQILEDRSAHSPIGLPSPLFTTSRAATPGGCCLDREVERILAALVLHLVDLLLDGAEARRQLVAGRLELRVR